MASDEGKNIPIIDFCKPDLKPGTLQWESTKAQVFKALQEYGCFEATFDKVQTEIRDAVFDAFEEVIPFEARLRDYIEKPFHRYEGLIPRIRRVNPRAVDLLLPDSIETFANTCWPDGNPVYCNVAKSYTNSLMELDEMVKKMILESLGLTKYIDEFLDASIFFLRHVHYKVAHLENYKKYGHIGHTDPGFVSIINQKQVGLQLLKKDGEWIEVNNVSPNSYIVLLGDSFEAWTNGRLFSATHRVMIEEDIDRFSMQLFSSPKPGSIMEAPKELVDEKHPLHFKPYDIHKYFEYLMSGAKDGFSLKAYCGV